MQPLIRIDFPVIFLDWAHFELLMPPNCSKFMHESLVAPVELFRRRWWGTITPASSSEGIILTISSCRSTVIVAAIIFTEFLTAVFNRHM